MKTGKKHGRLLTTVLELVFVLAVVIILTVSIRNVSAQSIDEGKTQLETSVRRAALACYAAEGIYPDSLQYLEEHYGLQIDRNAYSVHYDAFAENIMPDITVIKKSK